MSHRIVLLFVLASLGFAPAPFPRHDPQEPAAADPKADLKIIQGEWRLKSYRIAGRTLDSKSLGVEIAGERLTFHSAGQNGPNFTQWTFSLNAARRFRRFDLRSEANSARGIYRLKGGVLTIIIGLPGGDRPGDFGVKSGHWQLVLERDPTPIRPCVRPPVAYPQRRP